MGSAALPDDIEERRRQTQMKHFNRMHHSKYTGKGTIVKAKEWLRQMRKIMDTMEISSEEDRVRLASFHLSSDADQ